MLNITKDEAIYLIKNGWKWEEHIHRTYTKHPKYYATENWKLLKMLDKFRNSKIVETKTPPCA